MTVFKLHGIVPRIAILLVLGGWQSVVQASIWVEAPDAGDLPTTAQLTLGAGSLDSIAGTMSIIDDIDMFKIRIPNLSLFSATSVNPPAATEFLDTQLWLFDASGRGIVANGDTSLSGFETNSTIQVGTVTGVGGIYYLAISEFDDFPVSPSGAIFPNLFFFSSEGEVVGPTGPGGADPILGWNVDGFTEGDFLPYPTSYEIVLTGVEAADTQTVVPESSAILIWIGIGLSVMGLSYGRRFRSRSREQYFQWMT